MALAAMVVFDPPGEPRTSLMTECLRTVSRTVNWAYHRLVIVSNGICEDSRQVIQSMMREHGAKWTFLDGDRNIGTARGINRAWVMRGTHENCLKIDSDVLIEGSGWLCKLEECIARDPAIGIIGLKRKDCQESPHNNEGDWNHSKLVMLPHQPGETWLIVEKVHHVLGTCQLYSSALLHRIGYLVQAGRYGFDDSLAAVRCDVAGFYSCFYPHFNIDHPDPGTGRYQQWKESESAGRVDKYRMLIQQYRSGERNIYHGPDDDLD